MSDTYRTAIHAAKHYASERGIAGREGGWIYYPSGRRICQGWRNYAKMLVSSGIVVGLDGERLATRDGVPSSAWGRRHVRYAFDGKPVRLAVPARRDA